MNYYVYVLFSFEKDKFYIGFTQNLERRVKDHSSGQTYSTKRLGGMELIFSECFLSEADACRREKYFKTTKGRKALRLMLRETLRDKTFCPVV